MKLKVKNLRFGYKNKEILKDISFEAKEGEVTAIIGANAVGKSTLLKCIVGINKPHGEIFLDDQSRKNYTQKEVTKHIGYLTQENTCKAVLSVFEVVMLGRMHSLSLKVANEEIKEVWKIIKDIGIESISKTMFNQLSGGQRRVVSIAQTLVKNPKILILDEPTANLDVQNELEVLELIKSYTKEKNITTILTLHDLNMASRYADKIVILKSGKVYKNGTPKEVLSEETIREAYGVNAKITYDEYSIPMVHPINSIRTVREIVV